MKSSQTALKLCMEFLPTSFSSCFHLFSLLASVLASPHTNTSLTTSLLIQACGYDRDNTSFPHTA